MTITVQDADRFHQYILDRIRNGGAGLELDDFLMEWQHLTNENPKFDEDVLAIKAALRDFEAGDRGVLAEDFLHELRARGPGQCPLHADELDAPIG
jgi:hypothetical protein